MERGLWTDNSNLPRVAAGILQHALGLTPTEALVEAFLRRYPRLRDAPPSIEFASLKDWLDQVGFGERH